MPHVVGKRADISIVANGIETLGRIVKALSVPLEVPISVVDDPLHVVGEPLAQGRLEPLVSGLSHYYSCFALGDETIVPLNTLRNGEPFDFRYDSTASFVVKGFDETGTKLSILGINSFKFPAYVNFEMPKVSDDEKFEVYVNDKPVKLIQSTDEQGNWHVAFDVEGTTQNKILISGFKNPASPQRVITDVVPQAVTESEVSYLYYVIPIVFVVIIGLFVYRKTRSTTA